MPRQDCNALPTPKYLLNGSNRELKVQTLLTYLAPTIYFIKFIFFKKDNSSKWIEYLYGTYKG